MVLRQDASRLDEYTATWPEPIQIAAATVVVIIFFSLFATALLLPLSIIHHRWGALPKSHADETHPVLHRTVFVLSIGVEIAIGSVMSFPWLEELETKINTLPEPMSIVAGCALVMGVMFIIFLPAQYVAERVCKEIGE